jgi:DNA polymerase III epsilon subunit-like protein
MLKPIILDENTLILDTETTGLGSTAEICEISIINGLDNVVFDSLIKPLNPIPDDVIKIHGITNEMVANAPSFEDVYSQILLILFPTPSSDNPFKTNKIVIIYNKMYDLKILKQVSVMCNKAFISPEPFEAVDTYTVCAMRYYSEFKNQSKWSKLTDACVSMGIDISQFKAHRALGDCQMTLELIRCMNDPQYIKTVKKKEEIMLVEKPQTALATIDFDIKFTPSIIDFNENDFKSRINEVIDPVKNLADNVTKEVLTDTLAKLRKFQKAISDRRIAIVKDIKAPITDFEAKIKKGDAEIEQYINKYDANLKVILAKEKVAKHTEIEVLLPNIIENNKLDKEHTAKLTILEDYYLVKWTRDKIILDLCKRAEELFKQQDYIRVQEELKNTQIESRARLIEQLNKAYDLDFSYATFPITNYDDMTMRQRYTEISAKKIAAKKEIELAEQKAKEEAEKQIPVLGLDGDCNGNTIAKVTMTVIEEAAPVSREAWNNISAGYKMGSVPPDKLVGMIPKGFTATGECKKVYQNLRLGATSQADILSAVAKLKASGLSVEFI